MQGGGSVKRFESRREAGKQLGEALRSYAGNPFVRVLGLPRGGIEIAYEIAMTLGAPLNAFIVRKLGVPGHPELALGAIASSNTAVFNQSVISALGISQSEIDSVIERERLELGKRERQYRIAGGPLDVTGKVLIVADDGLATGASMKAAIEALRQKEPKWIVCAVPIAAESALESMRRECDEIVCLHAAAAFESVSEFYEDFRQTTEEEVQTLLEQARPLKQIKH